MLVVNAIVAVAPTPGALATTAPVPSVTVVVLNAADGLPVELVHEIDVPRPIGATSVTSLPVPVSMQVKLVAALAY